MKPVLDQVTSHIKVSIGMPVYNGANFIRQAIDSLLVQTHQNFELIISDNGSIDETSKICLEYAAADPRVKFSQNEVNLGAVKNFTKVLDLAMTDYFMWAAHDDIWESNYISTLIEIMEKDTQIVLAFTMFDGIDEQNQKLVDYPDILNIPSDDLCQRLTNYICQHERLGKANPFYGLMRKKYTQQALAATHHLLIGNVWASDMLFIFQVLTLGRFAVSTEKLFHKRIIQTSPSSTIAEDWDSYFNGYEYLINHSHTLNNLQKKRLIANVFYRRLMRTISTLRQTKSNVIHKIKTTIKSFV